MRQSRNIQNEVELKENKKLLLIKAKHLKGYVGKEMIYHVFFKDKYY
jgi:hypothetical protein